MLDWHLPLSLSFFIVPFDQISANKKHFRNIFKYELILLFTEGRMLYLYQINTSNVVNVVNKCELGMMVLHCVHVRPTEAQERMTSVQ